MDKYSLLVIFNSPFIIFGILRAYVSYQKKSINLVSFVLRLIFWLGIFSALFFTEEIYTYLVNHHLTDTTPLSIADVVALTGIFFCLFLILRLYSKYENIERLLVKMQQELSIKLSDKRPKR